MRFRCHPSCFLVLVLLFALPARSAQPDSRVIVDMNGDTVSIPSPISKVATIGAVPVINSLILAVDEGALIANGLGEFARTSRWDYQYVFAPQIRQLPSLQNIDRTPNLEELLRAEPDIILTMDRSYVESLRKIGLPVIYLSWRQPEDVKAVVNLLGDVLDRPQAAARYAARFDATLRRVADTLQAASEEPSVLYFIPTTLTQPHLIAEWWITAAGGRSVTNDGRELESSTFTMEQLLAWNPDILIVPSNEDAVRVLGEARFSALNAVRKQRVLVAPIGAHTWANRTSEQPLTVLWAASNFHPELFLSLDLAAEVQAFYQDIFDVAISRSQAEEILAGGN